MTAHSPKSLKLLGRLESKIVGIQYYEGAKALESSDVVLKRTPENPHDGNAVAVFTPQGCQIGHIPRYDAAYFAPLMDKGVLVLEGKIGGPEENDENGYDLPLNLEIFAEPGEIDQLLTSDESNDWRGIFHNLFVGLWPNLDRYSSNTLKAFRSKFRSLAHERDLYAKTQLFYRMLRAHVNDLDNREDERFRTLILSAVTGISFGSWAGWADFAVLSLDDPGLSPGLPAESPATGTLPEPLNEPGLIRHLPERCPYPQGAHGSVLVAGGELHSLDWFASAECAQVYWYQPFVDAFQHIGDGFDKLGKPGELKTPEETKADVLAVLKASVFSAKPIGDNGGVGVEVYGNELNASAIFQNEDMVCLRLRPVGRPLPGLAASEKDTHS